MSWQCPPRDTLKAWKHTETDADGKLAQVMERRYYDHKSHHSTKLQPKSVFVHAVLEMVTVGEIALDVLAGYLSSSTLIIADLINHDRCD